MSDVFVNLKIGEKWLEELFPNSDIVSIEELLDKLYELKEEVEELKENIEDNYVFKENGNIEYGVNESDFH